MEFFQLFLQVDTGLTTEWLLMATTTNEQMCLDWDNWSHFNYCLRLTRT